MKKLTILFMILALCVVSNCYATDYSWLLRGPLAETNDGIKWENCASPLGPYNDNSYFRPSDWTKDETDLNGQVAEVKIRAHAYIPCYIKLELIGNGGYSKSESFGPTGKYEYNKKFGHLALPEYGSVDRAIASGEASGYFMAFDNELGGIVDNNWNLIGRGRNIEVAPGPGKYIQACDTFKVKIFSNDYFKYEVIASALKHDKDQNRLLPLYMRSKVGNTVRNDVFDEANNEAVAPIENGTPDGNGHEVEHKFKVPYTTDIYHGTYDGIVSFKATTI